MDSENTGNASGERESSPSQQGRRVYQRHTVEQIQRLESYFKECSNPDDNQREELSRELSLDPDQIKFWFQNKRTQKKTQHEKEDNYNLRSEHEKLLFENLALREVMKGLVCTTCNYVGPGNESKRMQELRLENARLKEQIKSKTNLLPHRGPNPQPGINSGDRTTSGRRASSAEPEETPHQVVIRTVRGLDTNTVLETAASAMNELVELLSTTEPVWVTSSDGRCMLHRDTYEKICPMPSSSPLKSTSARIESSKDSAEVALSAAELAQLLYDPKQREEMLPAIVSLAVPIQALDTQNLGGSVHLVYEKMHVLSPHVAAREFVLIRYCRQLSSNSWAIADVSLDLFKHVPEACPVQHWKFPSGCMIQETSDGKSKVTWVEHVHVDDKSQNHRLYRDLVRSGQAYGAKRWIAALRTWCDRLASSNGPIPPLQHELEWVVATVEGRKNMMRLSHRMVRDFNDYALNMTTEDDFDFHNMCELHMTGVRVSMRRNDAPGQPDGSIVAMATSLWLPFSVDFLFNFFNDDIMRAKWDVLANGNPMKPIARISTGTHQGSSVAFMQPYVPNENKLSILQETVVDSLGAALVYAPVDIMSITSIINGIEDHLKAEILPSGVVISSDGRPVNNKKAAGEAEAAASTSGGKAPDGSLVTIAFQILGTRADKTKGHLSRAILLEVHSLIGSAVRNIREALNVQD